MKPNGQMHYVQFKSPVCNYAIQKHFCVVALTDSSDICILQIQHCFLLLHSYRTFIDKEAIFFRLSSIFHPTSPNLRSSASFHCFMNSVETVGWWQLGGPGNSVDQELWLRHSYEVEYRQDVWMSGTRSAAAAEVDCVFLGVLLLHYCCTPPYIAM